MPVQNEVPTLNSHSVEPSTNPCIPASTVSTPLGTLSILPPEIRYEIYRYLCSDVCYYESRRHRWMHQYRKWNLTNSTDLKMITLSKLLRQEYLAVLQAKALFVFHDRKDYCFPGNEAWTREDIPFIDRIQNVKIQTRLYAESDQFCELYGIQPHEENEKMSMRGGEPISFFAGKGIVRQHCLIRLVFWSLKAILILQSPFFNAVKRLTDFKTLTLKISSKANDWSYADTLTYLGGRVSCTDYAVGSKGIMKAMTNALEPSLGPGIIVEDNDGEHKTVSWKITFHPRDYVSKKILEAGSSAQEDQVKEGEEANEEEEEKEGDQVKEGVEEKEGDELGERICPVGSS